ncbi:DUF4189 domain-containing protein [Nocardia sp. NPDC050406]|uniref:DUF4189 domain-containing protein n=1 Tax=Nocardia sp. NPDC050406 TaxID=3364318 RepID=UPI003794DBE8
MSRWGRAAFGLLALIATVSSLMGAGVASAQPDADGSLYGALAISVDGSGADIGSGFNYPDFDSADARALAECATSGKSNCAIIVRFANGCGAIAEKDGRYVGRAGATRHEAEQAAIAAFGAVSPLAFGSSQPEQATLVTSECTENAS